ncbi:MAG: hypothetical protein H7Y31_14865 [Chitinophagaceae bacterium]|nr:hypothetical protein [Chitinophagaceae bacterium]
MKRYLLSCLIVFLSFATTAQTDTSLTNRLAEYTRLTRELEIVKLMDYIHPSLFELAPRDQMIEMFQNIYDSKEMTIRIGSLENKAISEPFTLKKATYRKVDYYMVMNMKFKDSSATADPTFVTTMIENLQGALPKKEVSFDKATNAFVIKGMDVLIAIKDDATTPWLFLGYDDSNPTVASLFPPELVAHFKLDKK